MMKKSMEKNDLRQVLKNSVDIISQLKNDFISPQLYYQLFTFIFDEILQMQSYFHAEIKRGRNIIEFYKSVQQCVTVLPRVYLMIIVGTLLIEFKKADTKDGAPSLTRAFVFDNMDDVIHACHALCSFFRGESSLYRTKGEKRYLLVVHQSQTPEDFNRVYNILSEYGSGRAFLASHEAHMREHEESVLIGDAVPKLGALL